MEHPPEKVIVDELLAHAWEHLGQIHLAIKVRRGRYAEAFEYGPTPAVIVDAIMLQPSVGLPPDAPTSDERFEWYLHAARQLAIWLVNERAHLPTWVHLLAEGTPPLEALEVGQLLDDAPA